MLCRATQDTQVILESSDKTWFTGGRNGRPLQYSFWENPMNSMKRQKDTTPEDEPPSLQGVHMLLRKCGGQLVIAPEGMKWLGQSRNNAQLQSV